MAVSDWGSLPFDIIENVFREMDDDVEDLMCISKINVHWSAALHASPIAWRACRYEAPVYARIDDLVNAVRFMTRAPPGSMRSCALDIDLWTCPENTWPGALGTMLGKTRTLVELLCDLLRDQRETLEDLDISFMRRNVSPSKMRRLISPIQSSFFKLAELIEELPKLETLSLCGGIFPCRIRREVDFRGVWMLLELYPCTSVLCPKIIITDISPGHFHMLMKCPCLSVDATAMTRYAVGTLIHAERLHLYAETRTGAPTAHMGAEHSLPVSPGVVPFILAMRATNYILYNTDAWEGIPWRNRLAHPELALRHGFFASRLPF